MGPKYEHFKFNIGEIVRAKIAASDYRRPPMMVVERCYQECPGGVQLKYACRHEMSPSPVWFVEIELNSAAPDAESYNALRDAQPQG